MGKLMFGTDEKIVCIEDLDIPGPNGDEVCIAHKYSIHSFGAPYRLTDDGYVLKIKGTDRYYDSYNEGTLSTDGLPPYEIPLIEYAFGHLLWIVIGGMALWGLAKRAFESVRTRPLST